MNDESAHLRGTPVFVLFSWTSTSGESLLTMMNGGEHGKEQLQQIRDTQVQNFKTCMWKTH